MFILYNNFALFYEDVNNSGVFTRIRDITENRKVLFLILSEILV